jgi:hypothetical protein
MGGGWGSLWHLAGFCVPDHLCLCSCCVSCQVGKALDVLRVDVPLGFDKEPDLSIYTEVSPALRAQAMRGAGVWRQLHTTSRISVQR